MTGIEPAIRKDARALPIMSKRAATKSPELHATQNAYAMARALCEAAIDAAKAECIARGLVIVEGMTDDAWETMSNAIDDVEVACGMWDLQTAKVEAERAMILWSLDASGALVMPGSEAAGAVTFIRERMQARKVHGDEWTRLVDLGFRLAA